MTNYIKATALSCGAIDVGFTYIRKVEPVIIMAFPFSEKWFFKAPFALTKKLGADYLLSKYTQDVISNKLKGDGYSVHYKTIFSLYGDFRPLAVSAGLGNWGRNGLLVNKNHGSGLLFCALFTNAPLSIEETKMENHHCKGCNACIEVCPVKAFSGGFFNSSKCAPHLLKGCGECLIACEK
jgi:epoxyqueuosine reductase